MTTLYSHIIQGTVNFNYTGNHLLPRLYIAIEALRMLHNHQGHIQPQVIVIFSLMCITHKHQLHHPLLHHILLHYPSTEHCIGGKYDKYDR